MYIDVLLMEKLFLIISVYCVCCEKNISIEKITVLSLTIVYYKWLYIFVGLKDKKYVYENYLIHQEKLQIQFNNVADVLGMEYDLFCVKMKYEDTQNNANLKN